MEVDIRKASFDEVGVIAASLGLPVYYPNISVPDSPADEHLRVQIVSTNPESTNICDGSARYQWILQIDVFSRDGVGEIKPAQHADNIKSALPFGTVLTSGSHEFRVNRTGNVKPPVYVDSWLFIPIQFTLETIN